MSGICVKMNGDKCAREYCDFWLAEEQACAIALETKLRIKLIEEELSATKTVGELTPKEKKKGLEKILAKKGLTLGAGSSKMQ